MYFYNPDRFSEIDHTADIGLQAEGESLNELFANLAFGMIRIISGEREYQPNISLHIELLEKSESDLIISWLSEINYYLNVHQFLPLIFKQIHIQKSDNGLQLKAELSGINILNNSVEITTEIKAVTYHQLKFEKNNDGYVSQVIFDI